MNRCAGPECGPSACSWLGAARRRQDASPSLGPALRADGLDRDCATPELRRYRRPARIIGPRVGGDVGGTMSDTQNQPSIIVTFGGQSRRYEAYVKSAPARLEAPSTMMLYT